MKKKTFVIALCLALVVAFAAGGAIAWLTDTTDSVTNTFTVGNVKLDLYEHDAANEVKQLSFKMIPGTTATKDPTVEVQKGSEECYVFVRVTETNNDLSNNRGKLVIYEIANGWTALPGVNGVYYYNTTVTPTATADVTLQVLKGDNGGTITFSGAITQADMDAITAAPTTAPTLSFVAYAVQAAGSDNATQAWAKIG